MNLSSARLSVVVALLAAACSGGSGGGGGGGGTTDTGSAPFDLAALTVELTGFTEDSLRGHDIVGDDLLAAMGIREALGGEAEQILETAARARDEALTQLPATTPASSGFRTQVVVNDLLWLFVAEDLAAGLEPASRGKGDATKTESTDATRPAPGAGAGATSTISQSETATVTGSQLRISIHRLENVIVTDATGAVAFEKTDDRTVTGEMTVCPDNSGVSNASMRSKISIDVTTHPGAAGRVGVHSVGHAETNSSFTGQVDGDAFLHTVVQDFNKTSDWRVTAAAEGGPAREHAGTVDVAFSGISTPADAAGLISVKAMDVSGITVDGAVTGDGTQDMLTKSIGSAALDLVAITPSYKEAQRLWRNGRCVVIAAPDYAVETPIRIDLQEASQHTENIDQSSTTDFAVSLHHRFDSATLTQEILADLTAGDKSLDPQSLPSGAGTLTYESSDENGKDATVRLSSKSNRGIGTLVLTFHTGKLRLQVDISGTQNLLGIIEVTLTISPIVLTQRPDGSFEGTGASSMVGNLGPCVSAFAETGTIGLTATQALPTNGIIPGEWTVISEQIPGNSDVTFNCEGETIGAAFAPLNYALDFVTTLGAMTVPAGGGTLTLHKEGTFGPIEATVVITVVNG